jgi:hypothetical protein
LAFALPFQSEISNLKIELLGKSPHPAVGLWVSAFCSEARRVTLSLEGQP